MNLESLKRLSNDRLKSLVLRVLRSMDSGGVRQSTLVKHICALQGVTTLRGTPREDFRGKVNHAVGSLLRERPPKIEKPKKSSDYIRLTKRRKRRPPPKGSIQTDAVDNVVALSTGQAQRPRLESYLVCPNCGTRTLVNPDAVYLVCRSCSAAMKAS